MALFELAGSILVRKTAPSWMLEPPSIPEVLGWGWEARIVLVSRMAARPSWLV